MAKSKIILTDSGGIQEESTYLGVQCITYRDNTERPCTVELGTNFLAGTSTRIVKREISTLLNGKIKKESSLRFGMVNLGIEWQKL